MASPVQFAYRTQKAIGVFDAAPVYAALPGFVKPEGNLRCCAYSPCGRYFAYASSDGVFIINTMAGHVQCTLPLLTVYELCFSPCGSFLNTWERPAKDENGDAAKNLKIWRTLEELGYGVEKQPLGQFVQKLQSGWNLQYTADEQYCARLVGNEVQFYQSNNLGTVWNNIRVEGVSSHAIAPGQQQNVAVFVPERKGQPAAVKIFNVPQFTSPISQKKFYKGDKVQLKWNAQGSSLIVLAQTDVDKTNKSYYGETTLYLLGADGHFDARISLDKEGPIHDVSWSPNSMKFGVVYGYMPAKTTIFNHRAVAIHSFPIGPRNTVSFSPTGRFVLVAGFGNLAGQIDVYDLEKDYQKVCTIESGNPSVCEWSPDSRYIMTATTSPRLRVDNGVKLWHVGGSLIYKEDMTELFNVMWRPALLGKPASDDPLHPVPTPHASALAYLGTVKTPSKPMGAYRPPGARGTSTPLHFKREDEGGAAHVVGNGSNSTIGFNRPRRAVPGAELAVLPSHAVPGATPLENDANCDEHLSKAALKNKKRANKRAKDWETKEAGADAGLAPPPRELGSGSGTDGRSPERRGCPSHSRSQSRSNAFSQNHNNNNNTHRARSQSRHDQRHGQHHADFSQSLQQAGRVVSSGGDGVAVDANQAAHAKKIRSLQKKIRAIEDLEMRLAGGEKLEDTQIKKIGTKSLVMKELEALDGEGA